MKASSIYAMFNQHFPTTTLHPTEAEIEGLISQHGVDAVVVVADYVTWEFYSPKPVRNLLSLMRERLKDKAWMEVRLANYQKRQAALAESNFTGKWVSHLEETMRISQLDAEDRGKTWVGYPVNTFDDKFLAYLRAKGYRVDEPVILTFAELAALQQNTLTPNRRGPVLLKALCIAEGATPYNAIRRHRQWFPEFPYAEVANLLRDPMEQSSVEKEVFALLERHTNVLPTDSKAD